MGREEQQEEREVLESIFPDEITDISDTAYRISIQLDVEDENEDPENPTEHPTLLLTITLPEPYPSEPPVLALSTPPNSAPYPHLDITIDRERLLSSLFAAIDENLGMQMVFTLVSTLKEAAETLVAERRAAAQEITEREARKAEEEENRKFLGEAVTRESFLAWQEKFTAEQREGEERAVEAEAEGAGAKKRALAAEKEKRLTGRELWERGMVGKVEEEDDDDDDEEGVAQGVKDLSVVG
ncbi:MAG: hypothetical protein M1832_005054 [Thelocarpon impressellum]|nr:MAG: hypothetical protein M1832_005054 [Thelocarpon impressellum]